LTFDQYLNNQLLSDSNKEYLKKLVEQLETQQYVVSSKTDRIQVDYQKLTDIFKEVVKNANNQKSAADFLD
jgi:hypothetical protein